jgi:hypothetical protein
MIESGTGKNLGKTFLQATGRHGRTSAMFGRKSRRLQGTCWMSHPPPVGASPHLSGKGAVNRIGVHAPSPQIG